MEPLTPERFADFDAVFTAPGNSIAKGCYCMYYRLTGPAYRALPGDNGPERARSAMRDIVGGGTVTGLLGYRDDEPVGWVSLGPREHYERLRRSPVMKPVDDEPVWSLVCFVVPSVHRSQGVASALLAGAVGYARRQGAKWLEAYPLDLEAVPGQQSTWFGTATMFRNAGFEEVARRKPGRPVMRLRL